MLGGEGVAVRDRVSPAREMKAALSRDRFTIIDAEIGRFDCQATILEISTGQR